MRSVNRQKNPFRIEEKRSLLAEKKLYQDLVKTYSKKYSEIQDLNNSLLWDDLNIHNPTLNQSNNPMLKSRLAFVRNNISGESIKVINIGFGTANLESIILPSFTNLIKWHGIDISPASVRNAKKSFPNAKFTKGSILKIKYPSQTFDYAIALEILEHIKPSATFKALSEIFRVLKPKGKLILSVPLNEELEKMTSQGINPNAHVRAYTPSLIKSELLITGFKILKEEYLYAFKNYFFLKTLVVKHLLPNFRKPNNIILVAQKPEKSVLSKAKKRK